MRRGVVFAMLVFALAGCGKEREGGVSMPNDYAAEPLVILAAASTKDAVEELAVQFERQTGTRVRVSAGPSNALATQIVSGAPADLFLSANEEWAEHVAKQGLAEATAPLLTNRLVLIVPLDNPSNINAPADLAESRVKRIALTGENVPAGMYAEQSLRAMKLYEPLSGGKKIVRGQDVRSTLGYVERGEVDAGIVYSTDAKIGRRVAIASEFDPQTYDQIVYPLVLVKRDRTKAAAGKLYEFMRSPEAAAIFEKFGFERISEK
jgi:molybdate transport system substrate-binding protein